MSDAVGGAVTKQISEKELDIGLVTLGAREVEVLGLPAHSGEVACRHDDEEFAAVWNARESTLGGEVLHERLRSEEHTSELQSRENLVCRLLLEKKKKENIEQNNH